MPRATNQLPPVAVFTGALLTIAFLFSPGADTLAESPIDHWSELKSAVASQLGKPISVEELEKTKRADKCGLPLLTQARLLDADLPPSLRRGVQDFFPRPVLPLSYDSPAGKFRIHYAATGDSAVFQANVDNVGALNTPGADGVPDFVNHTADIFDSVWTVILGSRSAGNLGYPIPPDDSTYGNSSSALYDVYLPDLRGTVFGLTAPEDSAFLYFNGNFAYPRVSFIVVDNDYQEPVYSQVNNYQVSPLDAMRVTAAHEFFHAIHFGIDGSEYPIFNNRALLYFQEMSSVSMEEYIYDDINDYYGYLYSSLGVTAFATPERSFQTFNLSGPDADQPYSMGVFMIYLAERFGPEIMRGAWEGCGRDGPDALRALDSALISFTANEYNFNRTLNEYGTWLLFTGDRAALAPSGVGFEEAAFYPMVSDTVQEHTEFPVTVTDNAQSPPPEVNSNSFVFFKNVFTTKGLFADCFKALVAVPTFTVSRGVQPRMSLIGIPRNFGEKATIKTGPFNTIVLDTNLVVAESARDSLRQALFTEYQCHDIPGFFPDTAIFFIVLSDTTDGAQDTVHALVKDFSPAELLNDPENYEYAILQVTHTSTDMADYIDVVAPAEYPYTYFVRDTSAFTLESQPFIFFSPFPNPISSGDNFVTIGVKRDPAVQPSGVFTLSVAVLTEAGETVRTSFPPSSQLTSEFIGVDWDFTNESGVEVASGVYLILEQLVDENGEVVASEVAKIFVMR